MAQELSSNTNIWRQLDDFADRRYSGAFGTMAAVNVPKPVWALAVTVLLGIAATAAFLTFVPWVQTANGTGRVTTLDPAERTQQLAALNSGRINKWFVRDGEQVKEGDPIVEIVDLDPGFLERLTAEQAAIQSKLDAAESATATARIDLERQRRLHAEGLAPRSALENAQIKVQELLAREAESRAALNQVAINLTRQSSQVVTAPRDGTVIQITAGGNATLVDAGQPIATLVPDAGALVVELFVTGLDAALITEDLPVVLQFEGWPAVQAGGWPAIARGTFRGRVYAIDPVVSQNGRFRVLITPDPDESPWPSRKYLRFGTQARGWILLEEVNVGYELWRRLNGFPPNQLTEDPTAT